jgi:hypothetical protein
MIVYNAAYDLTMREGRPLPYGVGIHRDYVDYLLFEGAFGKNLLSPLKSVSVYGIM